MIYINPYRHLGGESFNSTWKTDNLSTGSSNANQVRLPIHNGGSYSFVVNWGDGSTSFIDAYNSVFITHTYASAGTYKISIEGLLWGWKFDNTGDRLKLLSVEEWGILRLGNADGYFYGCSNLILSGVSDVLDLTGTTNLRYIFHSCTSLTTINRVDEWDVSAVTSMHQAFYLSVNFNPDISTWDTGSVVNMSQTFRLCKKFNQDISGWDTANVTDMEYLFGGAENFNQDIGGWNIEQVADFTNFMDNNFVTMAFTAANLDAIYIGWSTQTVLPNLTIDFGGIKHTAAGSAGKAILEGSPNNWTIIDGGI